MNLLVTAATIPVFALCAFIYFKDKNKEPSGLLALIFFLGVVSVIPALICELIFDRIFPEEYVTGLVPTFLYVFFGVAMIEEGVKWLITKVFGYNNKEFDEVFDILVYSVFASLGFACIENILYVLQFGLGNAFLRAFLAIPGHTCFAIAMGYFLSKAKVGSINGNKKIYTKNMIYSVIVPIGLHTCYDGLLMIIDAQTNGEMIIQMIPFLIFYMIMVVVCFLTVDNIAKVQNNLSVNIENGSIARNDQGILYYNYQNPTSVPVQDASSDVPVITQVVPAEPSFCPICGKESKGRNYCGGCGFKLK